MLMTTAMASDDHWWPLNTAPSAWCHRMRALLPLNASAPSAECERSFRRMRALLPLNASATRAP